MVYNKKNFKYDKTSEIINVLANNEIKQIIVNFIYSNLKPFSNFQNRLLEKPEDLHNINNTDYIINYKRDGEASYLLFLRNKDRYYSCVINKKHLPNDPNNIIIEDVHLIPFDITLELKIYDGTIIDGVYYSNKKEKQNIFYVYDILKFRGENKIKDNIKNKFIELSVYLKHFNQNKIYISEYDKIVNISNFYNTIPKDQNIKGFGFYPLNSGLSFSFIFNTNKVKENEDKVKIENKDKKLLSIGKMEIGKNKVLKLKKELLNNKEEILFNFTVKPQLKNKELFDIYVNDFFIDNLFLNLTTHKKLLDQLKKGKNIIQTKYVKSLSRWVYVGIGESETEERDINYYFDISEN